MPNWGVKLAMPSFHNAESEKKLFFQWNLRLGLEQIKLKQAQMTIVGDKEQHERFENEINEYIHFAEEELFKYNMGEIYVTDHTPRERKVHTLNKTEDQKLYAYHQALKEYNATPSENYRQQEAKTKAASTFLQRMFNPLAGFTRTPEGLLLYQVSDEELSERLTDEEKLRHEFNTLKTQEENPIEVTEDSDDLKIALLQELAALNPGYEEELEKTLDEQLAVFKTGQAYDFVNDIHDAHKPAMAKSRAEQIFDTIPDHYFWDIKTPLTRPEYQDVNPYNPFRAEPFNSFFDERDYEEYIERKEKQENIKNGVSLYRRY